LIGGHIFSCSAGDEINKRVYNVRRRCAPATRSILLPALWAVRLFEANPDVREAYGRRFEHVLVDEFQDTNLVQYDLLAIFHRHLALFVVGDESDPSTMARGRLPQRTACRRYRSH
jgi:DNA helicase-2/ATP-dependent DNA helicase PcrA